MVIPDQLAEIHVKYSLPTTSNKRFQITNSTDAIDVLKAIWNQETIAYQEAFVAFYLNRANGILGYRWISFGGTSGTVVDVKHVFGIAMKCNACGVILAHNHPSGNTKPSQQDISLTDKLKKAGEFLDIKVLDHLIVTPEFWHYSFADQGLL